MRPVIVSELMSVVAVVFKLATLPYCMYVVFPLKKIFLCHLYPFLYALLYFFKYLYENKECTRAGSVPVYRQSDSDLQ